MSKPKWYKKVREDHPELIEAYEKFSQEIESISPLNERDFILVKIGASVALGISVRAQAKKALERGLSEEEIKGAIISTTTSVGFSKMMTALKDVEQVFNP